jgi:hypothetical protein
MSDTGAPPDSSGSSMLHVPMHPMQMYQTNFTNSQLAQYNIAMNQFSGNNSMSSQDKKRNINKVYNKSNLQSLNQKQLQMMHNANQNQFVNHENWTEEHSDTGNLIANHYKMSNNQMKLGAATSTNFMNGNNQHFKMSMLRSVQQNMPNMPNVSHAKTIHLITPFCPPK